MADYACFFFVFLKSVYFWLWKKELSKKQFCIRCFGAYIYVNAVVLGLGLKFMWFDSSSLSMIIGMLFAVTTIFFIDLKTTDEINRRLKE